MVEIAAESAFGGATGTRADVFVPAARCSRPETGAETRHMPPHGRSDGVRVRLRPPRSGFRVRSCGHVAGETADGSRGELPEHVDERVGDAAVPSGSDAGSDPVGGVKMVE